MRLLTWNVNRKPAAVTRILEYLERLATVDSVMACLQEVPSSPLLSGILQGSTAIVGSTLCAVPARSSEKVVMVHSADLAVQRFQVGGSGRSLVADVRTPTKSMLQVAGIHARDRIFHGNDVERGGLAASLRREIDDLVYAGVPLAVMGDFNASSVADETALRACFYALDRAAIRERRSSLFHAHHGLHSRPLFVVQPDKGIARGTLYLDWGWRREWVTYDFAALDELLHDRVKQCAVLDALLGESLLRPQVGTPNKARFSDHLPVEIALDFH